MASIKRGFRPEVQRSSQNRTPRRLPGKAVQEIVQSLGGSGRLIGRKKGRKQGAQGDASEPVGGQYFALRWRQIWLGGAYTRGLRNKSDTSTAFRLWDETTTSCLV